MNGTKLQREIKKRKLWEVCQNKKTQSRNILNVKSFAIETKLRWARPVVEINVFYPSSHK
ncbi:hypothetical protein P872_16075 [Rhodonellum psychrophilum GCM71 = DSM 17998]|uniref:Uncharacterized protein n=1 Tax=Rhodonellum psychrophilum GCM71 = DSM 17998 TaxID=1123057 RepID=U5BS15_9BACT|nr:hypothetical protein P872_16075 [Rhodonellum psychrophilum GCM71 = DSM 17998]